MVNTLLIRSKITANKEVTITEGGNTYTCSKLDANTLQNFGGNYTISGYDNNAIARWTDVVVEAVVATELTDGSAFKTIPAVSDGTLPTSALMCAVEYTKELGTVGNVILTIGSQIFAELSVGEQVVIPISGADGIGLVISDIKLHADVYSIGVNEATVNVLLAGV